MAQSSGREASGSKFSQIRSNQQLPSNARPQSKDQTSNKALQKSTDPIQHARRIRRSEDQRIRGSKNQRIRGSPDQDIKPFFCPRQSSTATHQSNKSGKNTRGSERSSATPKAHSTPRGAPRLQQRSSTVRALRTPQRLPAPRELQAQPLIQTQRSSPPSLFKPFFCRGTERTSK